jgi:hypothetical protein
MHQLPQKKLLHTPNPKHPHPKRAPKKKKKKERKKERMKEKERKREREAHTEEKRTIKN